MAKRIKREGSWEIITPAIAAALLEDAPKQRSLRPGVVKVYAKDMLRDKWTQSESFITILNGHLINGQHRLSAVVAANKPVGFWVLRTNDEAMADNIDGGLNRSAADVLRMRDFPHAPAIASACRFIIGYDYGVISLFHGFDKIPRSEILEYADARRTELVEYASIIGPLSSKQRIISANKAVAFLEVAGRKEKEKAVGFITSVYTGNIYKGVAYQLREKLITNMMSSAKLPPGYLFGLLIAGFKARLKGASNFKRFRFKEDDKFPEL